MSRVLAFGLLLIMSFTSAALAHGTNESYVFLDVGEQSIAGRIEFRLADLNALEKFDDNGDGAPTYAELENNQQRIVDYVQPQLVFDVNGTSVPIQINSLSEFGEGGSTFAVFHFTTEWNEAVPDTIEVTFSGDRGEGQPIERALLVIQNNERTGLTDNEAIPALVFEPGTLTQTLNLGAEPALSRFWMFMKNGFKHILEGHDHVAFVIALLLPAVLIRKPGESAEPVMSLGQGLVSMLKVVTVFTIAHSITLSLAALDMLSYWSEMVEFLIAASIFIVALQNIFGRTTNWVYLIVFGLGLLHGLGFASVLAPYGTYSSGLWLSLLGFNLGVEVGQALIVLVLFPVLFAMRNWVRYPLVINAGGSAALALIALYWMSNRGPYLFASLA